MGLSDSKGLGKRSDAGTASLLGLLTGKVGHNSAPRQIGRINKAPESLSVV